MRKIFIGLLCSLPFLAIAQTELAPLTVEKIMRDPKWIGTSPSAPSWSATGDTLFFLWNPEKALNDSLYFITLKNTTPQKASYALIQNFVSVDSIQYNENKTAFVFAKNGDIFYQQIKPYRRIQITKTQENESNPVFSFKEQKVVFQQNNNLFSWDIANGAIAQLTNFQEKEKPSEAPLSKQEEWLKSEQIKYEQVLKERLDDKKLAKQFDELHDQGIKPIYIGNQSVQDLKIDKEGNYISYQLVKKPEKPTKETIVPNYITETGFTTNIPGRTKVGEIQDSVSIFVYDRTKDTSYALNTNNLEGIRKLPDYLKDYPKLLAEKEKEKENAPKKIFVLSTTWSPDGSNFVLDIRSQDFKDRWIVGWEKGGNQLQMLDHQHDEAWIDGPGIFDPIGWVNNQTIWFQSEVTGYSHLYTENVTTGNKQALTKGKYEIESAQISKDHKYFYITTNEIDPGQKQFYRLQISNGKTERLTQKTGANLATVSSDEKHIAFLYSYSNKPWELYIQENQPNKTPQQITFKAQSQEFQSYPWRDPQVITFTARDGVAVHARVYEPKNPKPGMPAVVFVHGAGYLQNAHKWWSDYFREYMFHNLLADNGYFVIDVDYRGSAGYGRDWRTAIYRHMGGKDLEDNVDAAHYLVEKYGVNPKKIGIYGGSYGGFTTLMAMFTTPDVFAAGAALRSVTDWSNYNHEYTADILNEPFNDPIAYRRSSPIYFAQGLKGHLLMCHGMVDENVHFQDIVKLTERLIELHKNNWELAVYPMEDHGFVDPSSWTDEYKRVFKLFESVLKGKE